MFDMLGNVFENLFSKPATRMYPFVKREPFKNTRGQVGGVDINTCIFCGICAKKCPSNAITVDRNNKSWEIDKYKCVICGACSEACPKKCLHMEEKHATAAYVKKKETYIQPPKTDNSEKESA